MTDDFLTVRAIGAATLSTCRCVIVESSFPLKPGLQRALLMALQHAGVARGTPVVVMDPGTQVRFDALSDAQVQELWALQQEIDAAGGIATLRQWLLARQAK